MSYVGFYPGYRAGANGLGFIEWIIIGAAGHAEAADQCLGNRMSEPDEEFCCHPDTWSNATYAAIKGAESLFYHNEGKTTWAFGLLRYDFLEDAAYDASKDVDVIVQPGFHDRVARAWHNYSTIQPGDRWYKVHNAVPDDCAGDGYRNVWTQGAVPDSPELVAALDAVSTNVGKTREQFYAERDGVIGSVYGSAPSMGPKVYPRPEDVYYVDWDRRMVVPTEWTQRLLDTYDPRPKLSMLPSGVISKLVKPKLKALPPDVHLRVPGRAAEVRRIDAALELEENGLLARPVPWRTVAAVGLGLAALGGIAYFVATPRRG